MKIIELKNCKIALAKVEDPQQPWRLTIQEGSDVIWLSLPQAAVDALVKTATSGVVVAKAMPPPTPLRPR